MKISIIYDNTKWKEDLTSDWGFSCLVEVEDTPTILFDTGGNGSILLDNMDKLDIDPASVDEVFISHGHFDHIGGLSAFLGQNNQVKVWVPPSFRGIKNAEEVVNVGSPRELHEGIYSTGELSGIEQSLAVKTGEGIVVIAGCSHPPMKLILETASQFGELYGIIGGLHGTRPEYLEGLELICATHCTQHKAKIRSRYPNKWVEGGAGKIIEIE